MLSIIEDGMCFRVKSDKGIIDMVFERINESTNKGMLIGYSNNVRYEILETETKVVITDAFGNKFDF